MTRRAMLLAFASGGYTLSCGYHVGGKADLLPKSIQTICIPSFPTVATRYKLGDLLPQQIGREFMQRTRFRIVNDPSIADAVLNGTINNAQTVPALFDPTSGKVTSVQVIVVVSITLIERSTGRVLYRRPNYGIRQNYDVAVDPHQYFDESGPALDRLSRDLAHDIVSAVVENF
ncbi:MAG: LPS assembly lipoprotein LptE [Bryobacteraceae bacterium]